MRVDSSSPVVTRGAIAVACILSVVTPPACDDDTTQTSTHLDTDTDAADAGTQGDADAEGGADARAAEASDADTGAGDAAGDATPPVPGRVVHLDDGDVQGDALEGSTRFLKIPFAKPPVGELRWKAPRPSDPWTGVRHESTFVAGCPQLADQGAPASDNEDCLYLNVWAPEPLAAKAPVMVWIHGGGNFSGAAGIPIPATDTLWYDGRVFAAKQGVVLVTINYRLGPFGFFAHPALAEEGEPAGNQGLLDQRLALEWVKGNVERFGGDPGNVTIFGESAGSADVCYHVASPGSRGLFHRAISESGGCTLRTMGAEATLTAAGEQMALYGAAAGCEAGEGQLDCLRGKSVEELLAHSNQPSPGAGEIRESEWSFGAVIDGEGGFLPDTPRALFDRGEIAQVPYLLGSNHDEGTTFVFRAEPLADEDAYLADLEARYGDAAPRVAEMYPLSAFGGDPNAARARVVGDAGPVCSTHDTARRAAKAGLPVFLYDFDVHWAVLPDILLSGHGGEISHAFGLPWLPEPDPDSERVAEAMNTYWARFARAGDPNGPGAPAEWPAFTTTEDMRLSLSPSFEVLSDFRADACAFWRDYFGVD